MDTLPLHFEELGSGPTGVIILHGLFGMGRNWKALATSLSSTYRVLMVDLRNHGASPWCDVMEYPALAADVAVTLEGQFTYPVSIIGHSMGGKVAMALACIRPELLSHLAVIDIAPVRYKPTFDTYLASMLKVNLQTVTRRAEAEKILSETIDDPNLVEFLCLNLKPMDMGKRFEWKINLQAIADNIACIVDFPSFDTNQAFLGPTLFLSGGNSKYVQPFHTAEIRRLYPNSKNMIISDAGHWLHAEKPNEVALALKEFLQT